MRVVDQTVEETGLAGQNGVSRQAGTARDARTGDAATGPAAAGPVVVGAVPRQPPGFLPRPTLLAQLNQAHRQASVVQLITGPPGAGKTQLAAAYARSKLGGPWRLVAWVSAVDEASLRAGLAAVADAAGLPGGGSGPDQADAGQAVRQLLEADGEQRLLVFDGVEDPDLVRPFVPASGAAQVLITSSQRPAAGLGTSITVDVFSAEETLAFLDGRTGLGEAEAGPVATALGSLPLALAQAAGAIAGQELSYEDYLKRLSALSLEEYLSPEQASPYPQGVAESVVLSLGAVQASDQTGVSSRVMAIMAVLSGAGVSRELLHAAGQAGVLASDGQPVPAAGVDQALEGLTERSLVMVSLDGGTVLAHRLATRVVRENLAWHGRLALVCRAAAAVLEEYGHPADGAPGEIPEQAGALLENMARLADATGRELADAALRLRFLALSGLIDRGDSAEAVALGQQLTAHLDRALGRDHPDTLRARDSLAAAYQAAGQPTVAIPMFELALAARQRVLGPDHPDTMRTRSELASAYRKTGQVLRAIPQVEQILATRERLLGAEHPNTLMARNNLAAAYREAGRAAEAVPLFEQTLAACERLLGADDPRTEATRNNLAAARREAGQPSGLVDQVGGDLQDDGA
jgi:tetratricopeptide (TPR) repeat protein